MNNIKGLSEKKKAEIISMSLRELYQAGYDAGFTDGQASTVEDAAVEKESYTTAKRHAKVGERVLVVDATTMTKAYENGDVCTVKSVRSDGGVYVEEHGVFMWSREYEVIEDKPAPLTANQQRAELIQRAREFVEEQAGDNFHFEVNQEKRTVFAWKVIREGRGYDALTGLAVCNPSDVFHTDISKAIALARALEIDIPQEFLEAVQPDEFVIGQVVSIYDTEKKKVHIEGELIGVESQSVLNFSEQDYEKYFRYAYARTTLKTKNETTIIDDTNAVYESVGESL